MKRKRKHFIRLSEPCSSQALTEQIDHARQAGFDGVDCPVSIASLENLSSERACEMASSATRSNVGAISVACSTLDAEVATQQITRVLRLAKTFGATCLNLTLPSLTTINNNGSVDEGFSRVQEASNFAYTLLRNVRFEAEAAGVAIALEAASGECFTSPVEMREMIDALHSWAIGVCVDVSQVSETGCSIDWLQTLLYRVHSVRIDRDQYNIVGCESDDGDSTLTQVLTTLRDICYECALIFSTEGQWSDVSDHIALEDGSG